MLCSCLQVTKPVSPALQEVFPAAQPTQVSFVWICTLSVLITWQLAIPQGTSSTEVAEHTFVILLWTVTYCSLNQSESSFRSCVNLRKLFNSSEAFLGFDATRKLPEIGYAWLLFKGEMCEHRMRPSLGVKFKFWFLQVVRPWWSCWEPLNHVSKWNPSATGSGAALGCFVWCEVRPPKGTK